MDAMIGLIPLGVILVGLFFSAASLKLGARIAGLKVSWGRSFLAVVVVFPSGIFVTFFGSLLLTPLLGLAVGWVVVLAILKALFSATWPQTLVIWVLGFLALIIIVVAFAVLTGLGIQELMKHMDQFMTQRELRIGLGFFLLGPK